MKLSVFNKPAKSDEVFIALEQDGDDVIVVAVDEDGNKLKGGNLVAFKPDGILHLSIGVNESLGFKLTSINEIRCQ